MSQSTAHTPSAYTMSLLVHGLGAALIFGVAYVASQQEARQPKVIELVAGAGENWSATEAPALGTPDGQEHITMPDISTPMPKISDPEPAPVMQTPPEPQPEPPAPPPEPVKQAKPEPKPKQTVSNANQPSTLDTKRTTFAQDVKRIADKRQKRIEDKARKEREAREARERKEAELASKRMSKADLDREAKAGSGVQHINAKGIAQGVMGGSTKNTTGGAGGKALSAEEASKLDMYFSAMKQKLRSCHTPPPGVGDKLVATVSFLCAADGSISQVRITHSSGNTDFDESVKEAFRLYRSIGSRPDHKSEMLELDFKAVDD